MRLSTLRKALWKACSCCGMRSSTRASCWPNLLNTSTQQHQRQKEQKRTQGCWTRLCSGCAVLQGLHSSAPSTAVPLSPRDGTKPADTGQHCLMEEKQTPRPLHQTLRLSCIQVKQLIKAPEGNYLEHVLHCNIHLQILLAVRLQSVVGEAIIVRCSKEVAVISLRERHTAKDGRRSAHRCSSRG